MNNHMFTSQLPNMFNMMNNASSFSPSQTDKKIKRTWVSENISQAKAGFFKLFAKYDNVAFSYISPNSVGDPDNICDVKVVYEHALDVAEMFADKGYNNFTKQNKMNPVVLNVVSKDFVEVRESSEDMRDELINIRTTFCVSPSKVNVFPIKEKDCAYTPSVLVIRPKDPRMIPPLLPFNLIYRTAVITSAPIKHTAVTKLSCENLMKTLINIETVFQCAIANEHSVLILTPYGHTEDNNPVDDIILIYNFCIMKYSHKFKHIFVAVPPHYKKEIFEIYKEGIIDPTELTKSINDKYENISKFKNVLSR